MAIRSGLLGYSFTALRIFQILILTAIVALTGRLAADVAQANASTQPSAVIWALAVCSLFAFWCFITLLLHISGKIIRYLITTVVDALVFPLTIVVTIVLGRPLVGLSCSSVRVANHGIGQLGEVYKEAPGVSSTFPQGQLYTAQEKPFPRLPWAGGLLGLNGQGDGTSSEDLDRVYVAIANYAQWVGRVFSYCVTMKIAWALSILMAITVFVSMVMAFAIWRKTKLIPEFVDHDLFETAGVGAPLRTEMRGGGFLRRLGIRHGAQFPRNSRASLPGQTSSGEHVRDDLDENPTLSQHMHRSLENRPVTGYSDANSSYEALKTEAEEAQEREERRKSSGDILIPPPPHLPPTDSSPVSPLASPSLAGSFHSNQDSPSPSQNRLISELPYPILPEDTRRSLARPSAPIRRPSYGHHRGYDPNMYGFPIMIGTTTADIHQFYRPRHQREHSYPNSPYPVFENPVPAQQAHYRRPSFPNSYPQPHHSYNRSGSYSSLASSIVFTKDVLYSPPPIAYSSTPPPQSRSSNHRREDSIADSAISGLSGTHALKRGPSVTSSGTMTDRTTVSENYTPPVSLREYDPRGIVRDTEQRASREAQD